MASNLVLQNGTALASGFGFSSLRQDFVRRLSNSELSLGANYRRDLVEQYIQLLVNSSHKFSYIKSIILQGLTKFIYMVSRSRLRPSDKKFCPLHRARDFKAHERKKSKFSSRATWYTENDVKDKYRNTWKAWITRRGDKLNRKGGKLRHIKKR